jgi:hypothetical protein
VGSKSKAGKQNEQYQRNNEQHGDLLRTGSRLTRTRDTHDRASHAGFLNLVQIEEGWRSSIGHSHVRLVLAIVDASLSTWG